MGPVCCMDVVIAPSFSRLFVVYWLILHSVIRHCHKNAILVAGNGASTRTDTYCVRSQDMENHNCPHQSERHVMVLMIITMTIMIVMTMRSTTTNLSFPIERRSSETTLSRCLTASNNTRAQDTIDNNTESYSGHAEIRTCRLQKTTTPHFRSKSSPTHDRLVLAYRANFAYCRIVFQSERLSGRD